MAVSYRVLSFGVPRGPWRAKRRQAEQDALTQGLATYDEYGQLYLDAPVVIQWRRDPEIRLTA